YRHVVDIFKNEKVNNVKWVWCFMNFSHPDESWNDWTAAYPGDEYVDWIGIDGYNWGSTQDWSDWQSFKVLFRDQTRRAKKLWPNKPIMIAEFASAEKGGNKDAWIEEIPAHLKSSMRDIDLIVWFDVRKEANWQIKSSKQSEAAFEKMIKDPIFSSSGEALAKLEVKPEKVIHNKAVAQKASGAIVIDGKLTEWSKAAPISLKGASFFKEGIGWSGDDDLSGDIYLMWDDENLYIAADVNDNYPMINNQKKRDVWNGDAIEVVMSVDPKADSSRTSFTGGDYQLGFGTGNGKDNPAEIWNWQRRRAPTGSEIAVKKKAKPLGYVLEAKIPWEFFRIKGNLSRGAKIGFDVAIDDADATGKREKQFIWNGDFFFYKDPSVWGVLELK
ncbi:MAG: hypothetical protein KKA31_06310, partial [Candidatus Margulisbacteria bacterium]|nr:hypothetical protein [Candidatus Margulisiibacteriota bacterium]